MYTFLCGLNVFISLDILLGVYLGVESLTPVAILLNHLRNYQSVFHSRCTILLLFYVRSAVSEDSKTFLHIHSNTYDVLLVPGILGGVKCISLWLWYAILWWLTMPSALSCIYWSYVSSLDNCLLGSLVHILIALSFHYGLVIAFPIFYILPTEYLSNVSEMTIVENKLTIIVRFFPLDSSIPLKCAFFHATITLS